MELIRAALQGAERFLPLLATIVVVIVVLLLVNRVLRRRWGGRPDAQFRFQLIMLVATFVGILAVIVELPISDSLRGQLLSLIGIILSAAIALSSTTFIGNIMAGIMLKTIRSARPGDFITLGDLTGRITEMDLLHTEVQTEFRDLVTVPNLNMVTQPMKVVRASGTIISAEVSLGYDVPNGRVAELLKAAAADAGLGDAFVHVRELGDFSVTYRVAGLLEDVQSLISARSALRVAMLNTLHANDIEIVSPTFMNQRPLGDERRFIPESARSEQSRAAADAAKAEAIAFDKANEAASAEELRKAIQALDRQLESAGTQGPPGEAVDVERLEARKARLVERLAAADEQRKAEDAR